MKRKNQNKKEARFTPFTIFAGAVVLTVISVGASRIQFGIRCGESCPRCHTGCRRLGEHDGHKCWIGHTW